MLSSEQLEALEADGLITPVEAKIANPEARSPANWPLQNKATMRITMRLERSLMPYQEVTTVLIPQLLLSRFMVVDLRDGTN